MVKGTRARRQKRAEGFQETWLAEERTGAIKGEGKRSEQSKREIGQSMHDIVDGSRKNDSRKTDNPLVRRGCKIMNGHKRKLPPPPRITWGKNPSLTQRSGLYMTRTIWKDCPRSPPFGEPTRPANLLPSEPDIKLRLPMMITGPMRDRAKAKEAGRNERPSNLDRTHTERSARAE